MFQNPEAWLVEEEQQQDKKDTSTCTSSNPDRKRTNPQQQQDSTSNNSTKKRKKADCSLLHRFVDPKIGQQVLQQIQTDFAETDYSDEQAAAATTLRAAVDKDGYHCCLLERGRGKAAAEAFMAWVTGLSASC